MPVVKQQQHRLLFQKECLPFYICFFGKECFSPLLCLNNVTNNDERREEKTCTTNVHISKYILLPLKGTSSLTTTKIYTPRQSTQRITIEIPPSISESFICGKMKLVYGFQSVFNELDYTFWN